MNWWSVIIWVAQFIYCWLAAWAIIRFVDPYVTRFAEWWDRKFLKAG
jgi:hypothetical protein